jgi:hypothetical protein
MFLNGYISPIKKRHIDRATKSITFNRCLSIVTGKPALTIWRRHCHILHANAATILTLHKFSNYLPLLSATNRWHSTCRVHQLHIQTIHNEPVICPTFQHVYHLREAHVCGVCRSIKLTSVRNTSEDFGIPNCRQRFGVHIEEDWGPKISWLMLGYYHNIFMASIYIYL